MLHISFCTAFARLDGVGRREGLGLKREIGASILVLMLTVSVMPYITYAYVVPSCGLQEEWSHKFGPINYFQTFCPSPTVADLGINENHGEPDADLEIVTGTDEWYGYQKWHCFDSTGGLEWTLLTGCDESRTSVAIADIDSDNDLEIVGGTTSGWELQVFDHNGNFVWTYYPGSYDFWKSSPAICDVNSTVRGLEVVAATYQDGKVWCFDGVTGAFLWVFGCVCTPERTESSPACADVDADGDVEVVIGMTNGRVYCLDGGTGAPERVYLAGGAVYSSAALANLDDDTNLEVVIGSNDGKIYCFDGRTAAIQWTYQTAGSVYSSPAIGDVDADGRYEVVVGSNDGKIYCLDARTGILQWTYQTGGAVISSPALANRGDSGLAIYVGSKDGYLYLLDGNGNYIDRFYTGATNGIASSAAVADIDGDHKLEIMFTDWNAIPDNQTTTNVFWVLEDCGSYVKEYAIEWQMFRRDSCHTGTYPAIITHYSHDVAVISTIPSKTIATPGEIVDIHVTVENQGDFIETTNITVTYDGNFIGNASVTLNPGEHQILTFAWGTTGVSSGTYLVIADASVVLGETDIADNTFVDGFVTITNLFHNIAVTSVTPSKLFIVAGEIITIEGDVENQGDFAETFNVTVYYDGNLLGMQLVFSLAPGDTTTLTYPWDTTGVAEGVYTITATADPVPDEIDLTDNTFSTIVQVKTPAHDIAVAYVTPFKTVVGQNHTCKIHVTVINQGDFNENPNVTVYYNGTLIDKQAVTNLPLGKAKALTFIWNTTGVAMGIYKISAEASPVPGETDLADNSLTDGFFRITIPGDINGDFKVDHKDLLLLAGAYGSPIGEPRYVPEADVDNDGKVDHKDLLILAGNYGKET